ncbi:hypothetical protein GCM10010357_29340 [Streptomyces luteireticuli]|uniref:Uncharacterized protein n=1 Tax=Streptomyces luteireticuli TaxID=173858 RepID=A0ABN0YRC7_9ACTN
MGIVIHIVSTIGSALAMSVVAVVASLKKRAFNKRVERGVSDAWPSVRARMSRTPAHDIREDEDSEEPVSHK